VDSPSDPVGDTVSAPVVLTRPTGHNQGLACLLSPRDIPVLEWPGGVIEPLEHTAPERADVVVFASPNAVRHCEPFPQAVVIAQGPGTARSLQERGISVHHIADPPRSSGVVGAVLKCAEPPATIVIVGGDLRGLSATQVLREHGFTVCTLTVYRNVAPSSMAYSRVPLTAVVYASPSAAQRLIGVNPWLVEVPAIAMGPTTAQALTALGAARISVASDPTDAALAYAVDALLETP
jgi:uroporphyrinogen-III synthase